MIRRATASIGRDEYDDPYIDWDDDPEGEWVTYRAHVEELRACEQRVLERENSAWRTHMQAAQSRAYASALDAARDAVATLPRLTGVEAALAAIDRLRGEQ